MLGNTMPDISTITGGIEATKSAWAFLEYLRSIAGSDVLAAYFAHDGTRIEGSSKIEIELHKTEGDEGVWWFSVKPLSDYAFIREPVTPSCAYELVGTVDGEILPDSRYWRWIAPVLPGRIYGGTEPVNLKVCFLVFGYRPKALLKHFGEK
jgi:hypothetical protein